MHKIKVSKLNAAYSVWGSRGSTSLRLFRVKSGLRLIQGTLLIIILILMAGDVSCNPGPMDISTMDISAAERNYSAEIENYLNIPVVISNRPNYSRSFVKPRTRHLVEVPIVNEQCQNASRNLRLCCLNAQSIRNKSADFVCYASSSGADVFAITETWLTERDQAQRAEITLPGFKLLDHSKKGRSGGGTALLFNDNVDVRDIDSGEVSSFEFSEWLLQYDSTRLRVIIIYRTPYSAAHPVTTSVFLDEFSNYLETVIMSSEPLLITGDFNIHVDDVRDSDAIRFLDLLASMGLEQHVDKPTHISGHTLDLLITRCSDTLIGTKPRPDYLFSDHFTVTCDLILGRPAPSVKQVFYRRIKGIDKGKFKDDILRSDLFENCPDTLDDLVHCYNKSLADVLDKHAPMCNKVINARPLVPWFNEEIKLARRVKRKAERKWRRTGRRDDMLVYKAKKNYVNQIMNEVRINFYQDFIEENNTDQRKLFVAAKTLLNQGNQRSVFPPCVDKLKFANQMGQYFVEKTRNIHSKLDNLALTLPIDPHDSGADVQPTVAQLHAFTALSEDDVRQLIHDSSKKSCSLDPLPTSVALDYVDILLPVITKIINLSLLSGQFAEEWKCALVNPLLKKLGLDLLFPNYRPVSNLQYISKLTEKAVFNQMHAHMTTNAIYPELQSSYRRFHSTETALLKVTNDILMKMNSQEVTLLVTLDLSAAFDTANHGILISRLHEEVGVSGLPLEWFRSYLQNRTQRVAVDGTFSERFVLDHGIPQGSCLGPLLFIIYSSKLFKVIRDQ